MWRSLRFEVLYLDDSMLSRYLNFTQDDNIKQSTTGCFISIFGRPVSMWIPASLRLVELVFSIAREKVELSCPSDVESITTLHGNRFSSTSSQDDAAVVAELVNPVADRLEVGVQESEAYQEETNWLVIDEMSICERQLRKVFDLPIDRERLMRLRRVVEVVVGNLLVGREQVKHPGEDLVDEFAQLRLLLDRLILL
jgi:hypothetical protein